MHIYRLITTSPTISRRFGWRGTPGVRNRKKREDTMRKMTSVAATVLFSIAAMDGAKAQSNAPTQVSTSGVWTVYSLSDKGAKQCYISSQPTDSLPKGANRDPIYFLITTRPSENVKYEASVIIGYPLKQDSKVTVEISSTTFTMFTKDDGAWLEDGAQEEPLVAAMKKGATMTVKGTSRRGTNTTDTYSLSGATAALDKMADACK